MTNIVLLSILGMSLSSVSFAMSCALDIPPLRERVRDADAIFVGVVQSDNAIEPAGDYDREAIVQVKKKFKGDLQNKIIVQYTSSKANHCDGSELGSLSVGIGKEKIFYVKRNGEKFFASDEMGVEFVAFQHVKQDVGVLPAAIEEASRPWWDFFGWTK